jgi:hypothetical protein
VRDFVRAQRAAGEGDFGTLYRRTLQFSLGADPGGMMAPPPAAHVPFHFHGIEVQMDALTREHVWRDLVATEVMRLVRADTDVVAELGSGWSANIFNLWQRGTPPQARYFGGEFAQGGREAAEALAASRPERRFAAPAFDWSFPDFSFVPPDARNLTFYSCYSIEQIPQLSAETFRELFARTAAAESVLGVFIEPVGWQWPEHADAAVVERTRRYAHDHNYNLNLREVVETLAAERRIEVLGISVDAWGYDKNPATIIHWRRL